MKNNLLSLDFILLLFISVFLQETVSQTQQILLCQPVNSVLQTPNNNKPPRTSILERRAPSTRSVRHHPTPRAKAKPDENKILFDMLRAKLAALEERMRQLEVSTSKQRPANEIVQEKCALHHGAKCYTFVKKDVGMITLAEAERKCQEISGSLANIYDEGHFNKIENYVLNAMEDNNVDNNYFILGMKYQNNFLLLHNGALAKYVRWYPGNYPLETEGQTQVMMLVSKGKSNVSGLYNTTPGSSAKSALCELHRRDVV